MPVLVLLHRLCHILLHDVGVLLRAVSDVVGEVDAILHLFRGLADHKVCHGATGLIHHKGFHFGNVLFARHLSAREHEVDVRRARLASRRNRNGIFNVRAKAHSPELVGITRACAAVRRGGQPDSTGQAVVALYICTAAAGINVHSASHKRDCVYQRINNARWNIVALRTDFFRLCQHINARFANVDLGVFHRGKINTRTSSDACSLRNHCHALLRRRQGKADRHRGVCGWVSFHAERQADVVQLRALCRFQHGGQCAPFRHLHSHVVQHSHAFKGQRQRVTVVQRRGLGINLFVVLGVDVHNKVTRTLQGEISCYAVLRDVCKLCDIRQFSPPPLAGYILSCRPVRYNQPAAPARAVRSAPSFG